jgi:uncharacterized repeat protein (TIGR01451 family)
VNATIDFTFVVVPFDLALTKVLTSTGTIVPGSDVTFTIEVYNQSLINATGVEVTDYIPTGMSLNDGAWTDNLDGTATILVGDIAEGMSASVTITLTVNADFMGTSLVNYAEISAANNAFNEPDEDSTPGDNQGVDEVASDNDIDDDAPGTPGVADNPADNDDYDGAVIAIMQEFDLALTKVLNTTGTIVPGDDVTYTIEVFNQGTLDATGVEVTDYIPTGMSLNDGAWTDNMDGTATILVGDIASGASATVTITLTIDGNFMGTSLVNYAEISAANNALGLPDEDSTPVDNQGTDETGSDNDIDDEAPGTPGVADNPADNDDYDGAVIAITQEFDLALTKVLTTTGTIVPGDDVTYTIEVFNQGTLDATGVEVTDYIPTGMSLNDGAWTDNMDGTATILVGDIASGASATVTITLTIDANFMGTSLVNYAEISAANNALGLPDEDSTPGDNQGTDELGTDNDIDDEAPGTPGVADNPADNDDYDGAVIAITQEFDLALTKVLTTTGTIVPGDDVTYTIEVFNQGTLDATGVEVTDYIPTGMSLNDGAWTDNMDGTATILVGDIASGASATVTITLTIDGNFMGTSLVNYAEISAANNALGLPDEDSTPGDNQGTDELGTDNDIDDEAPGTPGVADNPADNDDYDGASTPITQEFDLALTKIETSTGPNIQGSDVTYTIEVFNQGTLDATGVEVTDYIPMGMTLNDGAWTDNMDGTATILVGDIASGASATVTITLSIDLTFAGTSLVNYAEISDADNALGLPDEDSTPGDNQGTDETGTDDDIDDEAPGTPGVADNPADSDDYDGAVTAVNGLDYGDLPDSYATSGTGSPAHIITMDLILGSCVDAELDGQPEAMAGAMSGGDDNGAGLVTFGTCINGTDDEDGITFITPLVPGNEACIEVTATNNTGSDAVLQMWVDYNGDGVFGAGEEVSFTTANGNTIPDGGVIDEQYCFQVPAGASFQGGSAFVRFRLSPNGGLPADGQTGGFPLGEIEDYKVTLYQVGSYVWLDINNDGQQIGDFSGAFLNDLELQLIYAGPDGDLNTTGDNQTFITTPDQVNGLNGQFLFGGLIPGTYELSIPNLPPGFAPTILGSGGDNIDSNDPNGFVFTIPEGGVLPTGEDGVGDMPGGAGYPDTQDNWSFDFGLITDGYTITCNCDGSITIDWDPFAGGNSWTVTLEDMNGNPALNFVNMPESQVTIAPGSLNNLECYALAITENISGVEVASIQGYVCDVCYAVPTISMTGTGPSCLNATDGEVTITITEQGCAATYDVYLTSPGQADMLVGDDIMITAPIVVTGLGEGNYGVRLELVDQGTCFYGPNCFPVIEDNLLTLQNTDNTPPTKQVFDASGAEVTDMVFNYDQLPEGECGVQFTWTVLLDDDCLSAGVDLTATITTTSTNPSVNPSAQVTVLDNEPTYAVEVFAAVGTNTLTLTATDANGNSADMVYTINVADNRDPQLYCPSDMNVEIPSCEEDIPVNWTVSVVDDCDLVPTLVQTAGPASGDVLTPGTYTVSYEATDDYGNSSTCSFNINVAQAPSPEPIVDVSGNGNYTIEHCEENGLIVFSGNIYDCELDATNFNPADILITTVGLTPGAVGDLTISYTLPQDGYAYFEATGFLTAGTYIVTTTYQGVTVDHGIIVTQDPDQPAIIDMPGNLSYVLPECEGEAAVNFAVQLSDDCDEDLSSAMFTVNGDPAPPFDPALSDPVNGLYVWNLSLPVGTYTIVGTYTDGGGNVTTQEVTITVSSDGTDVWAPIITYPSQDIVLDLNPCGPDEEEVCFEVSATDNCTGDVIPTIIVTDANGMQLMLDNTMGNTYCIILGEGQYDVSIQATDAVGNSRSENFQIVVNQSDEQEVGLVCNDDINVTLNENCQREITADMLLEGSFGCLENDDFVITILDDDPSNGHILDGCGEFIYEIDLADGIGPIEGFEPCWGYITGEDKDDPILECPPNTGTGTIIKNGYTLSGTIDTNDPQVVVNDWSCLIDNTQPNFAGTRYVDVQSFQVSESDVYTFLVESDVTQTGNVGFAIYQGGYDLEHPCENIIAQADIPQAPGVGNPLPGSQGNDPYVRLALPLQAGVTYYLATTTFTPDATGNYQYSICADGNGQVGHFDTTYVTNPDWSVDEIVSFTPLPTSPVTIELPLHCEDFDLIFNNPASFDIVGAPMASDNCDANPDVTFEDTYTQNGDCGDIVITRVFTATDDKGNSSTCTQIITLSKVIANSGTDTEVWLPPFTVPIECDEDYPTLANGHPTPAVAGYPFVSTVSGIFDLSEGQYCNVGASYEDGADIVVCDGAYKFVRTWTIIDWCFPTDFYTYPQVIKVGDFTSPTVTCPGYDYDGDGTLDPLVFSTTPFACTAGFEVPLPEVEDNCSGWEVHTEIRTEVEVDVIDQYGQVIGTELDTIIVSIIPWDAPTRFVSGIPTGDHYFYYIVEDDCGNKVTVYCPFSVTDQIEPVAVCDDDLHVSIGGESYARLFAANIDEGSWDNCEIDRIEVRRNLFDPINNTCGSTYSEWSEYIDFFCCDVGVEIEIQLRVVDKSGNINTCWLNVIPEEKVRPWCEAPHNVDTDCTDLPYDFDAFDTAQLQDLFGMATATDNCEATAEELPPVVDMECGFGRIIRRFRATDIHGNQSVNFCQQVVDINEVHNFEIRFPEDAEAICGVAEPDSVIYEEIACDLIAVNHTDEFFSASGDECYKIFRTWKVVNWCQYDGEGSPLVIGRDEDCDGNPGDEAVWVLHRPNGYTYIDRDDDETEPNNVPLAFQNICQGFDDFWRKVEYDGGFYQYTQVIKVYDDIDPIITYTEQTFCSYDNVDCDGTVAYPFEVDENCTPDDLTIKVFLDAGADGTIDYNLTESGEFGFSLTGTYPNYTIGGEYPIGCHAFEVHVEDGCGNVTAALLPFCVEDCKAPSPVCINGLAIELMPFDVDGDDIPDEGRMAIWASDFIASPISDCTGPVVYSMNRSGEAPNIDSTGIVLTCADTGTLVVEIWAWDGAGNSDFCETYILVQDNMGLCTGSSPGIAGAVYTEDQEMVESVQMSLSGQGSANMETAADGLYSFTNLVEGYDYTITPERDGDYLNGVSTFDLVLISQHILGVAPLGSPYKRIAADANNSETITTLDLILLRKLILSIDLELANNSSWRFVDADYVFPNPSNPWQEAFPEVRNVNDLSAAGFAGVDFIAVKIGDVNGDAQANSLTAVEGRDMDKSMFFNVDDIEMEAGQEYTVEFNATDIANIRGYQATLSFNTDAIELVDIISGIAKEENFGLAYLDEGLITTSWHQASEQVSINTDKALASDEVMFSLVLRATANASLSEVLGVGSRITKAEAYNQQWEYLDVDIDFDASSITQADKFELYQNTPNPFDRETLIGFNLPEAGNVTLTIRDLSGKVLKIIRMDGVKGYNAVVLSAENLPRGVLYYTLEVGEHTASKKMIVVE